MRHALGAIPGDGILRLQGVVQVQEIVVEALGFGVGGGAAEEGLGGVGDGGVVGGGGPLEG